MYSDLGIATTMPEVFVNPTLSYLLYVHIVKCLDDKQSHISIPALGLVDMN